MAMSMSINSSELRQLASDFRSHQRDIVRLMGAAMKEGGEKVAGEYKSKISSRSRKIPGSIKVNQSAGGMVTVEAGGVGVPQAALLENKGQGGNFRHPVYGNRKVWVAQKAYPVAYEALGNNADNIEALVDDAVRQWATSLGFQ